MTQNLQIVGVQLHVVAGDSYDNIQANLARSAKLIEQAPKVDLYFLPELAATGYSRDAFLNLPETIGDNSDPQQCFIHQFYRQLAQRVGSHIGFSLPIYHSETQRYFISFVVAAPSGEFIYRYDKLHLCQYGDGIEKEFFVHGQQPLNSFAIKGIKLSAIICYDQRFAELPKLLVDKVGADVILHPCAFARDGSFPSWYPFATTRALENQAYFLSLNFAGTHFGGSIFVPPWIDFDIEPTKLGTEEATIAITIDPQAIKTARETYPFKKDARELTSLATT